MPRRARRSVSRRSSTAAYRTTSTRTFPGAEARWRRSSRLSSPRRRRSAGPSWTRTARTCGRRAAEDAEEGAAGGGLGGGRFRRNLRRGGGPSAETSAAAEGDSAENAPPVDPPRVRTPHAEHDPSAPWRAPVALAIAHYDEWDDLDEMPVWANNSKDPRVHPDAPTARGYTVAPMYQRRRPESPGYVPNHGYEGGVYLRFVLDHYDNLPDVAVFVQADADKIGDVPSRLGKVVTRQKERGDVGYLPINVGWDGNFEQVYFHKRDPYQEWWSETSLRDVDKCWRTVAGWWGHEWPSETVPTVSGYCCNYFAASRRKHPRDAAARRGAKRRGAHRARRVLARRGPGGDAHGRQVADRHRARAHGARHVRGALPALPQALRRG